MSTAQVKLNAVSSSVTVKAKAQIGKSDTSFSDVLNKENTAAAAKSKPRELKANTVYGKNSKEGDNASGVNTDNQYTEKIGEKLSSSKNETVYKAKSSAYQTDKDTVKTNFTEMPENAGGGQDEKVKDLMVVLASLVANISHKTDTDEITVKDFIIENNLTSENLLDIDSWKSFVTEINGLDDISAILTNDEAFKNLGDISEIINLHIDEMGQMTAGMTEGVTDETQVIKDLPANEQKEIVSFGEILAKMFNKPQKEEFAVTSKAAETEEPVKEDGGERVVITPLAVNTTGNETADTQSGFEQNSRTSQENKQVKPTEISGVPTQNLFDNIVANLQKLEGTASLPEGTTAKAILEQVANQIQNLHAPDRTSLEFTLTPETLGKVAINVSSKHGVLQAEFRVENADAKAALESQIAELKLNFENQGLKVANVSILISENGIGRDDGGRNTGEENKKNNNKRNRNFTLDGEDGIESISLSPEEAIAAYTDNGTGSNINLGA